MRVTVYLSDGGKLDVEDFDPESALDMKNDITEGGFATFEMDDVTVLVNTRHIVRVDIE